MQKSTKAFHFNTVNGTKAIPISQFPAEAWTSVLGGASRNDDRYKLYQQVPWLYRAVMLICEAVVGLPRNQEELDAMGLRVRWANFLNSIVGDYLFNAVMYCVIEQNSLGTNKEMRRFHPKSITPKFADDVGLVGFERKLNKGQPIQYTRDELGYSWIPSRSDELSIGDAPIVSALAAAGLLQSIDGYGIKYFKSGAVNPTLVEIEDFETMPKAEQERTRNIFKRMLGTGLSKAYEVFPIGSNTKVHTIGSPMKDLAVPELTNSKREDIANALGIPMSKLFSNAANYATAHEDNRTFYTETVLPIARRIEDMLNPYFAMNKIPGELKFLEQQMDVFQTDEADRSSSLASLVVSGIPLVTAMEILGYDLTDEQWGVVRLSLPSPEPEMVISETPIVSTNGETDMVEVRTFKSVESIATHLDMWERKATKAYRRQGNAEVDFESNLIPPTLASAIRGHLAEVDYKGDIPTIFQHAVSLSDHHHDNEEY
jgi:HK97 family phage portal protein